jgi:predicted MPP superfamily phosphohydrolase
MTSLLALALALTALLGHFALVVWTFNRLHAQPWPRRWIYGLERLLLLFALAVPAVYFLRYLATGEHLLLAAPSAPLASSWLLYPALAWMILLAAIPLWLVPKLRERLPAALLANDSTDFDVAAQLGFRPVGDRKTDFLSRLPGNEILRLRIQRKTLRLDRLPRELEGLTIAHLSDLHMTGRLTQPFYETVVEQTNALEPDLIVITGDIAEKAACIPWVAPTLGRLRARHGKFFVLGNHEMRLPDVAPLRRALEEAGIVDVASRAELHAVRETPILLAGSERPWFGTTPAFDRAAHSHHFRILLSHTPDEYAWARAHDFDLMLAGHNHGGQIRLPLVGPLITPSRFGFRYAGGVYHEPPTVLHVTRGLSGLHQVRFNCPPELALLTLVR